ncbi:Dak1 domain-containing protein [Lipomyces starkeyi]
MTSSRGLVEHGLISTIIVLKVLFAAAGSGLALEKCIAIGSAINSNIVIIGSSLDHCHVRGRLNHETLKIDVVVLGMGIHKEPGLRRISPMPSIQDLLSEKCLVDPEDEERGYVQFDFGDEAVWLVNNFDQCSYLSDHSRPCPETLCNMSKSALNRPLLLRPFGYIDVSTTAPQWPRPYRTGETIPSQKVIPVTHQKSVTHDFIIDYAKLDKMIPTGCERAINWDMLMGDGDCGDAVVKRAGNVEELTDSVWPSARKGASSTGGMIPRFGRATYITLSGGQVPPDPGAWAVYEIVKGMLEAAE